MRKTHASIATVIAVGFLIAINVIVFLGLRLLGPLERVNTLPGAYTDPEIEKKKEKHQ